MADARVLVTMDTSLLGTKLQTSADKTTTVEKDITKAVTQIFTLVKKTTGDTGISGGITGRWLLPMISKIVKRRSKSSDLPT